jgi:hypothetical protein
MPRDLPYVGISFSPKVTSNTPWFLRSKVKQSYLTAPANSIPASFGTAIANRTYSFSTRRGRTYELGRIEAGECNLTVNNSDGLFDPSNTSSAFYPNVLPYKPIEIACAYPLTGNILNDTNLAPVVPEGSPSTPAKVRTSVGANDSNFELGVVSNWYSTSGNISALTGNPHSGTYSLQIQTTTSALLDIPVVSGQKITISYWVYCATTSNVYTAVYDGALPVATVNPFVLGSSPLAGYLAGSGASYTANSTYTQKVITVTPQTNRIVLVIGNNNSPNAIIYIDDVQVEFGATASTYTTTGPKIYNLFSGFVERYPQTYQAPNRGQSNLLATDALGSMSQVSLNSLYASYLLQDANQALYYYPCNENDKSTAAFNQSVYSQPNLTYVQLLKGGGTGSGSGSSVFGVGAADYQLLLKGMNTTGAQGNVGTGTSGAPVGTFLGTTGLTDLVFSSTPLTFSFWYYAGASDAVSAPFTDSTIFATTDNSGTYLLQWRINATGYLTLVASKIIGDGVATETILYTATTSAGLVTANKAYYCKFGVSKSGGTLSWSFYVSNGTNQESSSGTSSPSGWASVSGLSAIYIGAPCLNNDGVVGHLAIQRGSTSGLTYQNIGFFGQLTGSSTPEQTGTRFSNMMKYFSGFNYVPFASDLGRSQMQAFTPTNTNFVDYAQSIADTESGTWFIDGGGFVNFDNRWDKLQKITPSVIFGDSAGEVPYAGGDLVVNYDPTYIYNDVEISRNGGVTANAVDSNSVFNYFPRSYTKTLYNNADSEAVDTANFILSRYKDAHLRPEQIKLTPARNPSIWASVLGLEVSDYVRVNKRPLGSASISIDCFIERIEHHFDAQTGDWEVVVTLSPAVATYWNLGAMQATTTGAATANTYVFTKGAVSSAGLTSPRDLVAGQMLQYTSGGITYVDVVSGAITETATTITVPVLKVGKFSQGYAFPGSALSYVYLSKATLTGDIKMDAIGTVNISDTFGALTNQKVLVDLEIIGCTTNAGNTITTTSRANNSTLQGVGGSSGTYTASHLSGATVYLLNSGIGGNVPAGTVVSEYLPNQITRIPYSAPSASQYNNYSKLGSWNNTLYQDSTNIAYGFSTNQAAFLTINPLIDKDNYPASDLAIGQIVTVGDPGGTKEPLGIIALGTPNLSGVWTLTGYKLNDLNIALSADMTIDTTTLNATSASLSIGTGLLIGNEFMLITGGVSGAWTVLRGTPDTTISVQNKSRHYQYDKIYTIDFTGLFTTYSTGVAVYEGYSGATIVQGSARLGY